MSKPIYQHHYVYRITNLILDKHYYGVRSSSTLPKSDLGVKYFSSSKNKDFRNDQKINPSHYRYKIVKICKNRQIAEELERDLHKLFNVGANPSFFNQCMATATGFNRLGVELSKETKKKMSKNHNHVGMAGKKHRPESNQKNADSHRGKIQSEEQKRKNSERLTGTKRSEETKRKMREAWEKRRIEYPMTDETRQKMSKSHTGIKDSKETIQIKSDARKEYLKKLQQQAA